MPIGKISKCGNNFSGAAEYDLAQGKYRTHNRSKKPEVLKKNLIFENHFLDIGKEFKMLAIENKRCKKPVLKFSISFDSEEILTQEQKLELTLSVMKEIGITDEHQFMVTRHCDKEHDHHHVLANRVALNGKAISDSYIINRLEIALDKVEKKMGLENKLSEKRRFVYDEFDEKGYKVQLENFGSNKVVKKTSNTKKGVSEKTEFLLQNLESVLQQANDLNEFYFLLKQKGIESKLRFSNSQKLTGVSFEYDNVSFKGSALGQKFKAAKIVEQININKLKSSTKNINVDEMIHQKKVELFERQVKIDKDEIDLIFNDFYNVI